MTDARRNEETGSLEAAVAATKRQFQGQAERADATEVRILTAARRRARPRRALWLAPIAAAFVISAALASQFGMQLAELGARLFDRTAAQPTSPAPAAPGPAAAEASSAPAASNQLPEPDALEAAPTPSATPPIPRPASRLATPVPSSSASSSAVEVSAPADELALYKQAHRAHFADQDYARALAGWDQYLATAPRGTFALEARYNRAIALHRLGNRAAAIEALRPFANGAYGRYRQEEARQLIEQGR
jgi:hypothetical protein